MTLTKLDIGTYTTPSEFEIDLTQAGLYNPNPCQIRVLSVFDDQVKTSHNLLSTVLPFESTLIDKLEFDTCPNSEELNFTYANLRLYTDSALYHDPNGPDVNTDQSLLLDHRDSVGGTDKLLIKASFDDFSTKLGDYSLSYFAGLIEESEESVRLLTPLVTEIELIFACTMGLPTLTTNSNLLDGFTYVRGDPEIEYTFNGWSANCDFTREVIPVDPPYKVDSNLVNFTSGIAADLFKFHDSDLTEEIE